MKLRADQFIDTISQKLHPVYFISGDEHLLVQEAIDALRLAAKKQGYTERKVFHVDRNFDWNQLLDESNNLSLFSDKRLVEIKLGKNKPGTKGSKALQEFCSSPPEDTILVLESAKMDAATLKGKWAQAIDRSGVITQVWPVTRREMPRWLSQRAGKIGVKLQAEALDLLSERLEGNLLAAKQELHKLKLLHDDAPITADMIAADVKDAARFDIFNLTDACLQKDHKSAINIVSHLKLEGLEPTIVLWALSKEIRLLHTLRLGHDHGTPPQTVFKQFRVISRRQKPLLDTALRHNDRSLTTLLEWCKQVDDGLKGDKTTPPFWERLEDIAMGLSQPAFISQLDSRH